jgi:hypothetical protein
VHLCTGVSKEELGVGGGISGSTTNRGLTTSSSHGGSIVGDLSRFAEHHECEDGDSSLPVSSGTEFSVRTLHLI